MSKEQDIRNLELDHNRDQFFRDLLRHLSGSLEEIIGLEDATGFISLIGQQAGMAINENYCRALAVKKIPEEKIPLILLDLKRRIGGDFYIVHQDEDKIVFRNRKCPFGESVIGRESLCMVTSNVFGSITSDNLGYAKITLDNTIARGDEQCAVTVYLNEPAGEEAHDGREYFGV